MPMEEKEKKKKNKKKTIITYVISFLCLFLCLYITIEIISANSSKRPPNIFGVSISYVPTNSMEPTIHTGDYIMFTRVGFDDVKTGDIIVYRSETSNIFIVHRVIGDGVDDKTGEKFLVTKGDNNPIPDGENITSDMVCGRFVTTLSFMGIFKGGINTNIIFIILVIIFVLMIAMQVFSIVMKSKNDKLKEEREKKKELLREELRKEILAEEIAKIKALNNKEEEKKEE